MAEEQEGAKTGEAVKGEARKAETKVSSAVPERVEGEINPSSPADTGTTPGSVAKIG